MSNLVKVGVDSSLPDTYRPPLNDRFFDDDEDRKIDPRVHYQGLIRRKWLILAVTLTVLTLVVIQTFTVTPIYKSTARIQIDPETSNVLPYKEVYEPFVRNDSFSFVTQQTVLKSRTLVRRVVKRLGLAQDPVFNESTSGGLLVGPLGAARGVLAGFFSKPPAGVNNSSSVGNSSQEGDQDSTQDSDLISRFMAGLEVVSVRGTRLVDVSYVSHDPQFAAKSVNTLAREFIEYNFESKYEATVRATEFLQRQLLELKTKIEQSEEALINYARANSILNIDERENIISQKLGDLNRAMTQVQTELIAKTAQYEAIRSATVENFPQSLRTLTIATLEGRLLSLEQTLASLETRFGPEWPEIVQARQEISKVKLQIDKEKKQTIDQAALDYRVAVGHNRQLSQALEEQKVLANRLSEDSVQYNILKREVDTNKQLYEGLLQRLKEAGVSAGLKSSNIRIVDLAEISASPHRPQPVLNLSFGLFLGLVLGVGLAFGLDRLDNTLKTPDELEQLLALPALGVVPTIAALSQKPKMKFLPAGHSKPKGLDPLTHNQPTAGMWEAYRSLRTSILLSHPGKPPQKILVTSAVPGEGKTTTVANLGVVLAQTGARTLILDLDMRRPTMSTLFGISGEHGMSAYLSGNSDLSELIQPTNVPNLYILPAGAPPPNPAELIGSEKMAGAVGLLAEYFKYIVIDSPPVLSVSDSLLICAHVDGVVLVVRGGETPTEVARKATSDLRRIGAKILGAMINNVDIHKGQYAYYYRHYYGRDYGEDYSSAAGGKSA